MYCTIFYKEYKKGVCIFLLLECTQFKSLFEINRNSFKTVCYEGIRRSSLCNRMHFIFQHIISLSKSESKHKPINMHLKRIAYSLTQQPCRAGYPFVDSKRLHLNESKPNNSQERILLRLSQPCPLHLSPLPPPPLPPISRPPKSLSTIPVNSAAKCFLIHSVFRQKTA